MRAALLLLACLAMPAAHAGIVIGTVDFDPSGLIVPDGPGTAMTVPVTVSCNFNEAWDPIEGNTLTVEASVPEGFTLEGTRSFDVPAETCRGPLSTSWTDELAFTLKADSSVPGLRTRTLTLNLSIPATEPIPGLPETNTSPAFAASTAQGVKAGFLAKVDAKLANQTVESSHAQASFLVQLVNRGNAATTVTVLMPEPLPKGITLRLPAPAGLSLPGTPGDHASLPILMDIGKDAAAETPIALRLHYSATEDRSQSAPVATLQGTVRIGSDGTEEEKKSPPAPLLFGVSALAVAALLRRRLA